MEYKMYLKDGNVISISEVENELRKIIELCFCINPKYDFDDVNIFINKDELHKLIGTLLHIQAKMK